MAAKILQLATAKAFVLISALSLIYVSILLITNSQAVMGLMGVRLTGIGAISSICTMYGVGITIVPVLLCLVVSLTARGIEVLLVFWELYDPSKFLTWQIDGQPGESGVNWLVIESGMCLLGVVLLVIGKWIRCKVS